MVSGGGFLNGFQKNLKLAENGYRLLGRGLIKTADEVETVRAERLE